MAKTLLIPIDFQIESLNTLRFALEEQHEPVNIVLLYGHHLSDSISHLLFYSPERTIKSLTEPVFEDALNIIKNRFSKNIIEIRFELLNSKNARLLENLIGYIKPDMIYIPKNYVLAPGKNGFDPIPLLCNTKIATKEVDWDIQTSASNDQFQALFVPINNIPNQDL